MEKKESIRSIAYQLIAPGTFKKEILNHDLGKGEVVIKPTIVSVCQADLRYYTGQRRQEALDEKLPMSLFHEGIGHVVKTKDPSISVGERVVIVPNIPERLLVKKENFQTDCNRKVSDNYNEGGAFLGSGYDGIGQEHLVLPTENVVPIPEDIPDSIAVLSELNSVSLHALSHVADTIHSGKVAVFGDGPVGFLTAAMLSHVYNVSKSNLLVFGAAAEKLSNFDFATTNLVHDFDFNSVKGVTTVIECTGGHFSESAINQAIKLIAPQGKIVLMGVSEENVPINTRDVLEKGLTLYGTSRSTTSDFETLMNRIQNKNYQSTLEKLLPKQNTVIRNIFDLKKAMDQVVENNEWKRDIFQFEWEGVNLEKEI